MFVAFTVKSDLLKVYGKVDANVIFNFVFRVGLAPDGVIDYVDSDDVIILSTRLWLTV
jgi:hypothetical protein